MVEVQFRIRNTVFNAGNSNRRTTIRPITFQFPTLEESALLASIDDTGSLAPRGQVFNLSYPRSGPVIEGFVDCALGEFVRAQLEALSQDGLPPSQCEIHGLEPFMETFEPENTERLRDLISVCEFRANEFTPESAVRFLKDTGFFDQYIIIGVKHGKGWRRSRCITTFEGRPADAGAILGHLADYLGKEQDNPMLEAETAGADELVDDRTAEGDDLRDGRFGNWKGGYNGRDDDPQQDGHYH
jgi:hypothetical protein